MRKILLTLAILIAGITSYSQDTLVYNGRIVTYNDGPVVSGTGSSYTAEYQAVLAAMTTDPTGDTLTWQNNFIYSLDTAGIWDSLDVIYVFAQTTNDAGEALINWKNPGTNNATLSGTPPSFVRFEGFTGNGSSSFVNTNFNGSTEGVAYSLNDAHLMVYSRTDNTTAGSDMGNRTDTDDYTAIYPYSAGNNAHRMHNAVAGSISGVSAGTDGFLILYRKNATDYSYTRNDAAELDGATSSTNIPNCDIYIGARNFDGTAEAFTDRQYSIASAGGLLTATQIGYYMTICETYMDAINKGVIP